MLSVRTTPRRLPKNEFAIDRRIGGAAADSSVSVLADAAKSSGTKKTVRAISDGVAGDSFMRPNGLPLVLRLSEGLGVILGGLECLPKRLRQLNVVVHGLEIDIKVFSVGCLVSKGSQFMKE